MVVQLVTNTLLFNVVTPTGLNDRQKAALKEFAAAGDLKSQYQRKKASLTIIKDAFEGE